VAIAVRSLVKKMYLYTNNHFAAKSVANALMIKERAGLPITGTYPPEFSEQYPEIAEVLPTDTLPIEETSEKPMSRGRPSR
jgi:hypothetical protein